ncbi:EamA family transporter [Zhengella sp. ZM62]|uniref:EamA family transporter n=1 Tax=Zhengella sedimenti TaxID=3390035 RepID=UPI0039755D02
MEAWIVITIAAAFIQNIRSSLQKHLKGAMGTTGATFVRFGFGAPFALVFLLATLQFSSLPLPAPNTGFAVWVVVGALSQIAAQALLVQMFSLRNFAVGSAYSRTEPAQAAVFGLIFLGDRVSPGALVAICVSVAGVMLISVARGPVTARALVASVFTRTAAIGLASGTMFGIAAVAYRAASLSLAQTMAVPDYFVQAACVLVVAILLQTVLMLGWMLWRDRAELGRIRAAWRMSALTGLAGATASFLWFAAMTLEQAAVVKALGQVEMLFIFASTVFVFREHMNRLEVAGCAMIVAGIVMLVLLP